MRSATAPSPCATPAIRPATKATYTSPIPGLSRRRHLEAHEAWWDEIWRAQAGRGQVISTLTPEFGPPPYMQTFPDTGMPLADTWDISNWMARRQAQRFELIFSAA